jgi:hypothetical protein
MKNHHGRLGKTTRGELNQAGGGWLDVKGGMKFFRKRKP